LVELDESGSAVVEDLLLFAEDFWGFTGDESRVVIAIQSVLDLHQ